MELLILIVFVSRRCGQPSLRRPSRRGAVVGLRRLVLLDADPGCCASGRPHLRVVTPAKEQNVTVRRSNTKGESFL